MVTGDASEFLGLAVQLDRASGQVGARAAAAVRKTAYDIEADAKALDGMRRWGRFVPSGVLRRLILRRMFGSAS